MGVAGEARDSRGVGKRLQKGEGRENDGDEGVASAEGGNTRVGGRRGGGGGGERAEGTLRGKKGEAVSTGDPMGRESPQ